MPSPADVLTPRTLRDVCSPPQTICCICPVLRSSIPAFHHHQLLQASLKLDLEGGINHSAFPCKYKSFSGTYKSHVMFEPSTDLFSHKTVSPCSHSLSLFHLTYQSQTSKCNIQTDSTLRFMLQLHKISTPLPTVTSKCLKKKKKTNNTTTPTLRTHLQPIKNC